MLDNYLAYKEIGEKLERGFLERTLKESGRNLCPACSGAARHQPIQCHRCKGLGWVEKPGYHGPEGYDVDVLP